MSYGAETHVHCGVAKVQVIANCKGIPLLTLGITVFSITYKYYVLLQQSKFNSNGLRENSLCGIEILTQLLRDKFGLQMFVFL